MRFLLPIALLLSALPSAGQGDPATNQGQNRIARVLVLNIEGQPVVDPTFSYNPSGGLIEAEKTGLGSYFVNFLGLAGEELGMPHGGNFQAQIVGGGGGFCSLGGFGADAVFTELRCFDASGNPADSPFIVWWIPPSNGENVSFSRGSAFGEGSGRMLSYTTERLVNFSAGSGVAHQRLGTGEYRVVFQALGGKGVGFGVQVTASGNGAPNNFCLLTGLTAEDGDLDVRVRCLDPFGEPVDSFHWVAVAPFSSQGGPNPPGLALAYALEPETNSYSGLPNTAHNPRGAPEDVQFTRNGTGAYRVVFADLDRRAMNGANPILTPFAANGRCSVAGLGQIGSDVFADVRCFDLFGNASDLPYSIALLPYPFENLVENGSFEQPPLGPGENGILSDIGGWDVGVFELSENFLGMPAYDGSQWVELDGGIGEAPNPLTISQTIGTTPGREYLLTFAIADRPQSNLSRVEALWNGEVVVTAQTTSQSWQVFDAVVVADGSTSRLQFRSAGPNDTIGDLVDDVRLVELAPRGASGPRIMSIAPNSVEAGAPMVTLTVNGSGFCDRSIVRRDGASLETIFVSAGQLMAELPGELLANESEALITVHNPTGRTLCTPGQSNAVTFTVLPPALPPEITSLTPNMKPAGSGETQIRVDGLRFCAASVVHWDGQPLETVFQSGGVFTSRSFLTATVPPELTAVEGIALVTVVNPRQEGCAGGTSDPVRLRIGPPGDPPQITSISPTIVLAGGDDFELRVEGTFLCEQSAVHFNGGTLQTTLQGGGGPFGGEPPHLIAIVEASRIATPGLAAITIQNPRGVGGCRGGISDPVTLIVQGAPLSLAPVAPPDGIVGEAYQYQIMPVGGTPPFFYQIVSGALPLGLMVDEEGLVNGVPTTPGIYRWGALVGDSGEQVAVKEYRIRVDQAPGVPPAVELSLSPLTFSFSGGSAPKRVALAIDNTGGGAPSVQVSAQTDDSVDWLSVSPSSGDVSAVESLDVVVTADPSGLAPGAYSGSVMVSSGGFASQKAQGTIQTVPVSMTIGERRQFLRLSLDGLTFTSVETGDPPEPLSFDVFNDGAEAMAVTMRADTFPAGQGWLELPVTQLNVPAGERVSVNVQVNQAGLAPAVYHGFIELTAPGASGGARLLPVTLNAQPASARPPLRVEPAGILVNTVVGGTPAPRRLGIANLRRTTSEPNSFESVRLSDGPNPFNNSPSSGPVPADDPVGMAITANVDGLGPGVHETFLVLVFGDGTRQVVPLTVIIGPAPGAGLSEEGKEQPVCPTRLVPVVQSVSGGLQAYAGSPGFIRVQVSDDCGQPLLAGPTVEVRVDLEGTAEPPTFLRHVENGRWDASVTAAVNGQVTVNVTATDGARGLTGQTSTSFMIDEAIAEPPVIFEDGLRQAASFASQPLPPGSFVSIFGENLAQPAATTGDGATTLPLPEVLANTSVLIAGATPAPMQYALGTQLNIVLPFEQNPTAGPYDVLVLRGSTPSEPFTLQMASAQPGIFTIGSAGFGEGVIQDGQSRLVSTQITGARAGVSPGEAVIIYATGLGAVDPPVPSGTASPASPLAAVAGDFTLTIGGVQAQVFFAGLTPSFVSLYQVNAFVPEGLSSGPAEVLITVDGRTSASGVTLAIE